jgi:hypothetical protein
MGFNSGFKGLIFICFVSGDTDICMRSGFVLAQIFRLEMLACIYLFVTELRHALISESGPSSSVTIETGYGLEGPGIESRWRRDFSHLSRPALGSTKPPVQWVPGLSRGKERPGRDAYPSPPSSAVGQERVELYIYSPYGSYSLYRASVPVQRCTLP